ncbi:phage tail protein [Priestia flexa]|uniref:phage tail protein n=1 Tax=Priestia flexa TaxID=86664 RepID=UPI001A8D13CB|nr:phage tail protein [Priestia flexa]MBN8434727.1 phage tail protein [Priestia flexa]MCA0967265.1 phage tail protein [Priestia flexa]
MRELYVEALTGEQFPLSNYKVTRNASIENSSLKIKVEIIQDHFNQSGYEQMQNQAYLVYEGDKYVIANKNEVPFGRYKKKNIIAEHIFYQHLKLRNRIYATKTGSFTPKELIEFSIQGSGYTLTIDTTDLPAKLEVENFGNNNSLALVQDIVDRIEGEFDYIGNELIVAKQIGRVTDKQIRHEFNVKDPSIDIDTSNLRTYIRGFSQQKENGSYTYQAEYRSPLADVFGILIADPVYDDRYTSNATLLERLKKDLTDAIDISIRLTAAQLKEMDLSDVRKGDWLWCILDPFDIDVRIRVVDIEDYEDENKPPVFTLGTIKRKASDIIAGLQKTGKIVEKAINTATGKVKTAAIDTSNLSVPLDKATGQINETQIGFTIPTYQLANSLTDGLMSSTDFTKLSRLNVDQNGNVSVPLASSTTDGLLSAGLFQKLNLIQVDEKGQAFVDLTSIEQELQNQQQQILQQQQEISNLNERVVALENASSS